MGGTARQFDDRTGDDRPLLSIVCAVFNGERTLPELLDSYAEQRRPDCELLVIDAASTDRTWTLVHERRPLVAAGLSEPDHGIYDAWNKALPLCRGCYVSFIGCDDRLAPAALAQLCAALSAGLHEPDGPPQVLAGFNILTRAGMPVSLLGEPWTPQRLPRRMMVAHVMAAHRLDWLREHGGFDSSFRSSGDYELLLRARHGLRVRTLPRILAFMADGGTSRQRWRPHLENYRARRKNGLGPWLSAGLLVRAAAFEAARSLGLK
jgi:glycosyltransferase involved in cell wall biosynthesis